MRAEFIRGRWQKNIPSGISLVIADPPYSTDEVSEITNFIVENQIQGLVFMRPGDLCDLPYKPEQILFWIKPESTKNTSRKYSCFVEIIAGFNLRFADKKLHWSNRTGIFTDRLFSNDEHEWKKPESLIERLLKNHYPGDGLVFDPFAGSGTVSVVCNRLNIPSYSVELEGGDEG